MTHYQVSGNRLAGPECKWVDRRNGDHEWDVIVVGSGANGGAAAKKLSELGLSVLVLEAGAPVLKKRDFGNLVTNGAKQMYRHLVSGSQKIQKSHPTYWMTNPDFFVDDKANPYSTPDGKPFHWIRGRRLGGRTLVWDAVTIRLSDYEFKAGEYDGLGPSWPIGHDDLDPYYTELEKFFQVHGDRDGLDQVPDGTFEEARPMTPAERLFQERVEGEYPGRRVVISRGLLAKRMPSKDEEFTQLSSVSSSLKAALLTNNCVVQTGAIAAKVLVSADGSRATGVEFVNADSRQSFQIKSKAVFLCASTLESVRLLMNSKSSAHPEGIGGTTGVLGRYVMDHSAGNIYFSMPEVTQQVNGFELTGCDSIMVPRYQNLGQSDQPFPRGFGVWGGIQRIPVPKILAKRKSIAFGFICARSETLAHEDNHVRIDPELKDAWGIPALHIDVGWKDVDVQIATAAREQTEEMVTRAGGQVVDLTEFFHTPFVTGHIKKMQREWKLSTPGMFVHEVGGARMGDAPTNSVVDPFCRVWEVPNVYVTDGAVWPTSGWQNPTLTEMAVTTRACVTASDETPQA